MSGPALNNSANSRASRAPFAAAVSFLVMIVGAAFIFISAQQTARPAHGLQKQVEIAPLKEGQSAEIPSGILGEVQNQPSASQQNSPLDIATSAAEITELEDTILSGKTAETLPLSPNGQANSHSQIEGLAPAIVKTAGVAPKLAPEKKWTLSQAATQSDGFAPSLGPSKVEAFKAAIRLAELTPSVSPHAVTSNAPQLQPVEQDAEQIVEEEPTVRLAGATLDPASKAATTVAPSTFPLEDKIRTTVDIASNATLVRSDTQAASVPPLPLVLALDRDVTAEPETISITLKKGENFVDALKRAGVRSSDRNDAASAFGKLQNLRRLRPGQTFNLTVSQSNQTLFQMVSEELNDHHLVDLNFRADAETRILLAKKIEGGFDAEKADVPLTTQLMNIKGDIKGSLYLSAKEQGAPDRAIANLANAFAYDVDFQREIFGGDEFEAIFEVKYDDEGQLVSSGDILFARLKWRGKTKEKGYYRFASANGGSKADFFDASGQSAKRLLMKTPIDGARLSSGFGSRKHPILGYRKAHKGVDFAARRGTPIYAAGDGVVERANRFGSFGNYIKIRHSNGFKTAYAHLKGFKKGIRAGKRVEQGDVIGYVGTTGRSTGPHLHYEVHYKGKQVNPQKLKIATGISLKGDDLKKFNTVRDKIDELRAAPQPDLELVSKENDDADSL